MSVSIISLSAQNSASSDQKDEYLFENMLLEKDRLFFQDNTTIGLAEYQKLRQLHQATIYIESNNFLKALEIYLSLYQEDTENSEILLGVANTYFLLGDFFNAKRYYNDLYKTISLLHYDARNTVRYRLALLYFLEANEEFFVAMLQEVIEEKEVVLANSLDVLKKILIEDGVDQIHVFVKVDFDSSFYAFRELGIYYLNANQQEKGIKLLLYALSMSMTHINNYLAAVYPTYKYTDIFRMIDLVYSYQESLRTLDEMEFQRMLLSVYRYINNSSITDNLDYDRRYVYSLIEIFDRNAELLIENFLFAPFLL